MSDTYPTRIRLGYGRDTYPRRVRVSLNSDARNSRTDTYPTATSRPRAPLGSPALLRSPTAACCSAPPMAACHPCRSSRLRRSARGRPRRAERRVGSGGGGARKPPLSPCTLRARRGSSAAASCLPVMSLAQTRNLDRERRGNEKEKAIEWWKKNEQREEMTAAEAIRLVGPTMCWVWEHGETLTGRIKISIGSLDGLVGR